LENKPNLEDLQKEYMKDIFPYEQHLDISLLTKNPSIVTRSLGYLSNPRWILSRLRQSSF